MRTTCPELTREEETNAQVAIGASSGDRVKDRSARPGRGPVEPVQAAGAAVEARSESEHPGDLMAKTNTKLELLEERP